jgi:hypothetical protein
MQEALFSFTVFGLFLSLGIVLLYRYRRKELQVSRLKSIVCTCVYRSYYYIHSVIMHVRLDVLGVAIVRYER